MENLNSVVDKNLQIEKASAEIEREIEYLKENIDSMESITFTSVTYY